MSDTWPAEEHFWAHKCHMSEEHGSIAMTEAQCESQHVGRVFPPCLPGFPTTKTSIGSFPVSDSDHDN